MNKFIEKNSVMIKFIIPTVIWLLETSTDALIFF